MIAAVAPIRVPVSRPRLPTLAEAMPYLLRIDATRVYTNRGPLCRELESRLAERFGLPASCVATVANATLGLVLALQAQRRTASPRLLGKEAIAGPPCCALPAFSFAACAQAVELAGFTPLLVDVSPEDWALSPLAVRQAARSRGGTVGALMVVSPFGQPIDPAPWEDLAAELGAALVVDGAAAFDTLRPGRSPAVVSLHATKVLGAGEGGFVVATDVELIDRVRRASSFGFAEPGVSVLAGLNAKMSEYHAALGLAALDRWPETRAAFRRVALDYREALAGERSPRLLAGYGTEWVGASALVHLGSPNAETVVRRLAQEGIEARRWWGPGLHRQPAFSALPRSGGLAVTEELADSTLGLPCAPDLSRDDIRLVCEGLARALGNAGP